VNAKLFSLVFPATMLSGLGALAQVLSPDLKPVLAPLGRFVGTWEKHFTIYKSEWSPTQQTKTGTHSCKWILDERHLQETGRDSDGSAYMSVSSYDAAAKAYRMTVFQSNGSTSQMSGKWDDGSNTFTWSRDLDGGIRMTASYQLVKPDEFKFSYVARDGDSKVYFRLEGTGKRVQEGNK
jgi:hypothetical protein